jgi:hypothetical protein
MTLNSIISYNSATNIGTWNSTNYNLPTVKDIIANVSGGIPISNNQYIVGNLSGTNSYNLTINSSFPAQMYI